MGNRLNLLLGIPEQDKGHVFDQWASTKSTIKEINGEPAQFVIGQQKHTLWFTLFIREHPQHKHNDKKQGVLQHKLIKI